MISGVVLIIVIMIATLAAGIFGGSEIGIYQLSRVRLRLGVENKRFLFLVLGKIMHDSPKLLISTLIGTNLAYYIVTSLVTYSLLGKIENEHTVEILTTALAAPLLFIFAELIPKNIFFYRADVLMPYSAPVLFAADKIFSWCGLVGLLSFLSRHISRLTGATSVSKKVTTASGQLYIKAILRETSEEASLLSSVQIEIIYRLAGISQLNIRTVMTPLGKVEMVALGSGRSVLMEVLKRTAFSRLLVYEGGEANVVGFVNIYECLNCEQDFADLRNFGKPIRKLSAETSVIDSINIMQNEKHKIVLATKPSHTPREKAVGIVTMKDLVEELVGELAEW